ncbi:hypothetical protein [Burkholderia ubonensis]|uniref:hypothetical protein n=1 Tax=Burkholderia ubonensis TaxID=101571 RepID=UPI0012F96BBF|nr:hypothetical protein [Burkholderia ubonensis]
MFHRHIVGDRRPGSIGISRTGPQLAPFPVHTRIRTASWLDAGDKQPSSGVGEIMSNYLSVVMRLLSRINVPVAHYMTSSARPALVGVRCVNTVRAFAERREASGR